MDFATSSPYGKFAEEILSFFVPLALSLPKLRSDSGFMKKTVKTIGAAGTEDIVTAADTYIQREIKNHIKKLHPDWQFWGEEGKDNVSALDASKKYLLITDPIEGTINFTKRNDDAWGSVVALVDIQSKQPVIGIIAHPSKRKFYVGIKGSGSHTVTYDENGQLSDASPMNSSPEYNQFTYNNSPHFSAELSGRVKKFLTLQEVKNNPDDFVDPESGALEAVRYRGAICFKTNNEMAAVFVILGEIGGSVTDADGKAWFLGINTLIAARKEKDYLFLKGLMDKTYKGD